MGDKQALVRILYAEDDLDIQVVVSLLLAQAGDLRLKMCNHGLEAVREVEAFDPQLLLLDMMMPELDGLGALMQIREIEAYREIPAIFLTAKVHPVEVQACLDMGAVAVISKPFDPMTLVVQIREFWATLHR